ncbi:hypothetical protein NE539_01895 [Flavonifractor plautii]|jgi:hypothetical protein|uniref:hypothetical protein n=1 Tax=Flavonifractor plautii TaxID=292800 RepID=UPI00210E6F4B|nr:hypothetical protein [Flavonifractor plautii]MCQ4992051.1 hypothetical protein [Flavonifractor plautii]
MNPEFMDDLVINLAILCVFLLILGAGCLIADFVFPRIPFLQKWLESLPEYEDDMEIARLYEKERRERRARRRARRKGK